MKAHNRVKLPICRNSVNFCLALIFISVAKYTVYLVKEVSSFNKLSSNETHQLLLKFVQISHNLVKN